jgi:hypothetical protein
MLLKKPRRRVDRFLFRVQRCAVGDVAITRTTGMDADGCWTARAQAFLRAYHAVRRCWITNGTLGR